MSTSNNSEAKLFVGFILILTVLSSCEYGNTYYYKVTNNTDTAIFVHCKSVDTLQQYRIDTNFIIPRDSSKIIFTIDHGIQGSAQNYLWNVSKDNIKLSITRKGALSHRDYAKSSSWAFCEDSAMYLAVIYNSDF